MTVSDDLCGALYLTQPGPLWSFPNAAPSTYPFTDIRHRQCTQAAKELAIHAPHRPHASDHLVHSVWGQWVPGYRSLTQPYTPAQRDRVRPANTRYLQGQSGGPDKVLDAYLKTCPAPTATDVVGARTNATGAKAHALAAADAMPPPLHPLTRAVSSKSGLRLGGPFRDYAATAALAPLAVAMTARRGRLLAPNAVRAESRRVRRTRMPAPAVHTRAVPPPLRVGFRVQPNRFAIVGAPGTATRPALTSVVTHPWAVTAYAVGRLERHLLDQIQAVHAPYSQNTPTNMNTQRQEVKRRVQWVRMTLHRLHDLSDWQAACVPGTDLLQPRKIGGLRASKTESDAPSCPTPSQWRRGLLAQFDHLCPQSTSADASIGIWADALDTIDVTWWYGDKQHAAFVASTTVDPADAPLLEHMAKPPPNHLNDAARRAYVRNQRPKATDAKRHALVQAGEWYTRFILSSDAARRKDMSLPSWTLTYAAGMLSVPSRRRSESSLRTRRATSSNAASSAAPSASRRRRRRSGRRQRHSPKSMQVPPSSPKKSGGEAAAFLSTSFAPSHQTRPVRMDPLSLTQDISVSRASASAELHGGGEHNPVKSNKSGGGKSPSGKRSDGARTIVLDTRVSGTTTASLGGRSKAAVKGSGRRGASKGENKGRANSSKTTKPLVTVTKQGDTGKTPKHRLTEAEVGAYRKGLHKHVKANGGRAYVESQQAQQQRKAPAFDFVQLFPKDSPFLKTIPGKLRKSARNRNALRRVKREVLRTYGYHKSTTYKRCSSGGSGGSSTTGKDPLVEGGTSRRRSSPRLQDGHSEANKHGYTGALYTRKRRPDGGESTGSGLEAHQSGGGASASRVTWVDTLSTGEKLVDTSTTDMEATKGLSALDLGALESVVVG